jgi:glutamine synthetase
MNLDGITTVRTEAVTTDGLIIGKHLSRAKFEHSLPLGHAVSDLVFGYDIAGAPQFGWWDDWRNECLGDIQLKPDLDTLIRIPSRPGLAACLADFTRVDGEPLSVCPRSTLKRVAERLATHGLTARAAFEIEGMLFTETLTQARAKGYRGLTPIGLVPPLAYLTQDAYHMRAFFDEASRRLDGMGIPWDAWSAEAAPAQFEVNLPPSDAVTAADRAVRVKATLKEVAIDLGLSLTFMAKPTESYGNGMHIHHSLQRDGSPAFFDAAAPDKRSALMCNWIGGLIATMPGAHSFLTPTINSYRRMVGFAAAPLIVSWAEENKSTALRVISRTEGLSRVEHRVGAGDLNPYLALAAILAGGIVGIEQSIDPPPELGILAWGLPETFPHLPRSITEASQALALDKALADVMGTSVVHHWVNSRRWEWLMFHMTGGDAEATSVTDWELNRYFELV